MNHSFFLELRCKHCDRDQLKLVHKLMQLRDENDNDEIDRLEPENRMETKAC